MNAILLYLLEVNIIVTVVYLAYRLLLSRDTHFQWRRAFMLAGVTVAVVFPLVDFGVTAEKVGGRVAYVGPALQVVHGAVSNVVDNVAIDVQSLLVALYVSVAAVLLLYLVVRVGSVFALVSRYDDMTVADRKLFVMPGNSGAFSFFGFIFVSEGFIDDDNVISHEAVHVDQLHSVDVLMSEFLSILCWFNPVAWLLRGEMRDNLEYIADSRVMTRDNRRQYQMSLLAMTDNQAIAKFYNNFNVSSLKKRIKMMNQKKKSSVALVRYMIAIPAVLALAFICSNWADAAPVSAPDTTEASATEEEVPQFPGGMVEFQKFMMMNLHYPAEAFEANEQGTVVVQMCINADGSVSDAKVVKSVSPSLDAAAVELISKSPRWEPLKKSKSVCVNVPVIYKLSVSEPAEKEEKDDGAVPATVAVRFK